MCLKPQWFVYIIKTDRNQLYTGITTDVERRFLEHLDVYQKNTPAKGAKFFRSQKPVAVVYRKPCSSRSEASKLEWQIKTLTRKAKELLITAGQ